jgi:hypothetical protein
MQSIQLADFDRDTLRTRLRKMSDEELREFGKAARYMFSPRANMGKPPLPTFVSAIRGGSCGVAQETSRVKSSTGSQVTRQIEFVGKNAKCATRKNPRAHWSIRSALEPWLLIVCGKRV